MFKVVYKGQVINRWENSQEALEGAIAYLKDTFPPIIIVDEETGKAIAWMHFEVVVDTIDKKWRG